MRDASERLDSRAEVWCEQCTRVRLLIAVSSTVRSIATALHASPLSCFVDAFINLCLVLTLPSIMRGPKSVTRGAQGTGRRATRSEEHSRRCYGMQQSSDNIMRVSNVQ
jgi:hypothetical protein